ncbi:amino acid permease-domain-containing protein [Xylaria arbuscula]|nr:amino acid permease-domain-containing protein [Xylaria arbuscula]
MASRDIDLEKPDSSGGTSAALGTPGLAEYPKTPSTQLRPMLSEHHVNMMSFSQCIGIGLFLQTGRIIYLSGPGLATIAYILAGTVLWSCAACLGEMAALFPVKGPIIEFPRRFLDESLGYSAGWLAWFSWIILIAAELVAITHIFQFKYPPELLAEAHYPDPTLEFHPRVSPAVLVFSFLIIMLLLNMLPVRQLGRIEYIFGLIKMLFIILMILLNVALQIQRLLGQEALWTYNDPYSFKSSNLTLPSGFVATGGPAQLGAFWDSLNSCLFGLIGFETIAITAAENRDLRSEETVKIGTRKIALRIILLYSLATFTVGFNVPYTYPQIVDHKIISFGYGQNCVFVISPILNRLRSWPYFINDFIIFSATTAGANGMYNASRTLHALASIPEVWPDFAPIQTLRRRLQRTSYGVPHAAVLFSAAFGMLGFLAVNENSQLILGRLVRFSVTLLTITYGLMAASFLSFFRSLKAAAEGRDENIDNKDDPSIRQLYDRQNPQYPYRSHGQWLRAVYGLFGCSVLVLFNGWRTFSPPFSAGDFVACYIGIVLFIVLTALYQIKFWGWDPRNWQRRATNELQIPRPEIATSVPRRGQLALVDTDNLFIWRNVKIFGRWLWVWLK